jgi:hypothetical protein
MRELFEPQTCNESGEQASERRKKKEFNLGAIKLLKHNYIEYLSSISGNS